MKKSLKVLLCIICVIASVTLSVFFAYFIITTDTYLDENKLEGNEKTVTVHDLQGNKIKDASLLSRRSNVYVDKLNPQTVNAFIASEDKTFFTHNGINFKRILKASYKNFTSRSFKEGASTITQQLIKNTHLNNDKTLTRKIKEIKLAKQLEKRYTKEEILQMYLNIIYFGHNCYGLENASQFYFGKPAEELNLEQSATIVGLLSSPNNYSPFKNPDKCLQRRNVVLKSMLNCKYIDSSTYENTIKLPLSAKQNERKNNYSDYVAEVFTELEDCQIDPYGSYEHLNVYTYFDKDIQNAVDNLNFENDTSIIIRSTSGGVSAYRSTCGLIKRPIGSTAKPLFVYAPALNENKINLFTKICDEPIDFNGYKPENYDKKYRGYVSVEDAITQSLNVPAVKTLNSLTVNTASRYAKELNVDLTAEDMNLSLALGAMSEGLTIKELCDCYSVFPTEGNYTKSAFIQKICDEKGNCLYKNTNKSNKVFDKSTCSLINRALINATKTGTAKRLAEFSFDVACKTGTCGTKEGNTDAYALSYTSQHLIGVWAGDKANKKLDITGGKYCCEITKDLLNSIYKHKTVPPLDTKSGVTQIELDKDEYENNNRLLLCDDNCPKLNRLKVVCGNSNLPKEKSSAFTKPTIKNPTIVVDNNNICIILCQTKYYEYVVKRRNNGNIDIIYQGKWKNKICEELPGGEYEYCIIPYYTSTDKKFFGEEIWLPKVKIQNISPVEDSQAEEQIPDIVNKDWFDNSF
ncbi:MAG: transglycosylase domain-containing protein [Candidatus Coproplasma sp.]